MPAVRVAPARYGPAAEGLAAAGVPAERLAAEVVWRAIGWHPFRPDLKAPARIWYATTTFEKVGDTLWAKLDPAEPSGLLRGLPLPWDVVWHNKPRNIPNTLLVHLPAGTSKVSFKAFEQGRESFQAVDLDFAAFDEQFGQDIFTETTTRIGPGREVAFSGNFTPLILQDWLERRTTTETPASDDVFYFPLDDQRDDWGGFIPWPLISATIDNWPPEVRETRRYGRRGAYQGAIFQTFRRDVHVLDEARERAAFFPTGKVPYAVPSVGSIDWGGNNPFVFLWVCRVPALDEDLYVFDELYWDFGQSGPRRLEEHAKEILARTAAWGTVLQRTYADHDPTDAREMAHYGVPSIPANKADRLAGIEALQTLLAPRHHLSNANFPRGRPGLHVAARCKNLIRELAGYRWKEGTDRQDAPREPLKKDDHTVDALRYAVESERHYSAKPAPPNPLAGRFKRSF